MNSQKRGTAGSGNSVCGRALLEQLGQMATGWGGLDLGLPQGPCGPEEAGSTPDLWVIFHSVSCLPASSLATWPRLLSGEPRANEDCDPFFPLQGKDISFPLQGKDCPPLPVVSNHQHSESTPGQQYWHCLRIWEKCRLPGICFSQYTHNLGMSTVF